jgi:hypothetical protein
MSKFRLESNEPFTHLSHRFKNAFEKWYESQTRLGLPAFFDTQDYD